MPPPTPPDNNSSTSVNQYDLPIQANDCKSFYRSRSHYVLTLERVARHLKYQHNRRKEHLILILTGLALIISMILQARGIINLKIPLGQNQFDLHIVGMFLLFALMFLYHYRLGRLKRSIINQRRCFSCGESLLPYVVDEHGVGSCPYCNQLYNIGWYKFPTGSPSPEVSDDAEDTDNA